MERKTYQKRALISNIKKKILNIKNIQNILFDLDGTLTDPKEGIINSYIYSIKKFGIQETDPESLAGYIGNPLQDCFINKYSMKQKDLKLAITYYREYFSEKGAYENKIYPGIPELLLNLKNKGKKLYIVTTKAKLFAEKILLHFDISKYFESIYGSALLTFDFLNKGKSDLIKEAMMNENLNNTETIMIGDRKFDINGARENGITSIAVTYGYGSIEELKEAEADYIVRSLRELSNLLQ